MLDEQGVEGAGVVPVFLLLLREKRSDGGGRETKKQRHREIPKQSLCRSTSGASAAR